MAGDHRAHEDGEQLARERYEALVIGTGFGGAVAACRLAQAGLDVAVVERGRRWRRGAFPRDLTRLDAGWLWPLDQGLYDARPLNDILAVQAAGYGGGSLVYANVAARPPAEVFDSAWPEPYGRTFLDPYFDLASHMLDIRPVPADPRTGRYPAKVGFMERAAARTGNTGGFMLPNLAVTFDDHGPGQVNKFGVEQSGCVFCAECGIGCNVGAKNTLDHNYLALAERAGAAVGTRTEAVWIARDPAGDGYILRLREHGRDGAERDVAARYVFVCAGAIGTTELLLRSRDQYGTLPHLPPSLGHGYSGNGDFLTLGHGVREPFRPGHGPVITTATLVWADTGEGAGGASGRGTDGQHWFVVEDGGYSEQLARLIRLLHPSRLPAEIARQVTRGTRRLAGATRELGEGLDDDTAVLLVMGRDRADGRIELRGPRHRLHVTWDVPRNSPLYAAERAVAGEIVRGAGGKAFVAPTWRLFRQPVTVHNLGGARLATRPDEGVADPDGEVFGHPGLYVLDGAALPGATGANPSLTIAAVAERCIEAAVRRITGDPGWVAPETPDVRPVDLPEDRAVHAVVGRGPWREPRRGVRFHEVMRGWAGAPGDPADRRRVTLRLDMTVPDLAAMLDDPVHTVRAGGTVEVGGLTRGAAPVRDGSLHLLASPDGSCRRTMDYALTFAGADGREWLLQGSKRIEWRRGNGPYRATTVLDVALTAPGDRHDGVQPTGRVRISFLGGARLVLSARATGTRGRLSSLATLARFGWFFVAGVARAYLPSARRPG